MRSHDQIAELLADHVAGRLADRDSAEVTQHIGACDVCAQWTETYRLIRKELRGAADPVEGHLTSEVLARLAADPQSLEEAERGSAASHLEFCDLCSHQLELSQEAIFYASRPLLSRKLESRHPSFTGPRVWLGVAAALIVVLLAGPLFLERWNLSGPAEERLSGRKLQGTNMIRSRETISADAIEIPDGADVTFRAGKTVVLGDGFSVGSRARFVVEIQDGTKSGQKNDEGEAKRRRL